MKIMMTSLIAVMAFVGVANAESNVVTRTPLSFDYLDNVAVYFEEKGVPDAVIYDFMNTVDYVLSPAIAVGEVDRNGYAYVQAPGGFSGERFIGQNSGWNISAVAVKSKTNKGCYSVSISAFQGFPTRESVGTSTIGWGGSVCESKKINFSFKETVVREAVIYDWKTDDWKVKRQRKFVEPTLVLINEKRLADLDAYKEFVSEMELLKAKEAEQAKAEAIRKVEEAKKAQAKKAEQAKAKAEAKRKAEEEAKKAEASVVQAPAVQAPAPASKAESKPSVVQAPAPAPKVEPKVQEAPKPAEKAPEAKKPAVKIDL